MRYLLDVNALVALGFLSHEFHNRVASWVQSQQRAELATCSITELGFVRVLSQAPAYGLDVAQGRSLLVRLKEAQSVAFISDTDDISRLPGWVKTPKQITDGHLCNLARQNGASFATLAESVPDSYLIPRSRSRMI